MSEPTFPEALAKVWMISARLRKAGIWHEMRTNRYEAISILAHMPGEYWEIDVCDDGSVDVEIFKSQPMRSEADLEPMIQAMEAYETPKG